MRPVVMLIADMISRLAAAAVLILHLLFVLFAVLGGLLILLDWRWMWVHLPAVTWSSVVNLAGWTCPLTPLENTFRRRAGSAYEGDFIQHYVGALVYPKGMPRTLELVAGVSIVAWNTAVYAVLALSGRFVG